MNIHYRLSDVFRRVFEDKSMEIKNETTAQDVPGWDSLTHIDLIIQIEEEFGITFTVNDLIGLANVGEMLSLIERKLLAKDRKL
jgi:acyl carrier protein